MGLYKKDNKLRGLYQLRGHIEDDKEHYLYRIKPIFDKLYGTNISLREMPSTRVFGFQIWNTDIVEFKKKLGLPLGKKLDMLIPKVFLDNLEFQLAVIRGIFDTDGSINLQKKNGKIYPRIYITTICPTLATQLFNIFNSLGLRATSYIQKINSEFDREKEFRITIRGVEMLNKFMSLIRPANPKHIKKYRVFLNSKSL